jgi:hypothetical protein
LCAAEAGAFTVPAGARALAEALLARHGGAVQAIVLYGSCYRRGDDEGLADLYVLVERYRDLHGPGLAALANRLLPPGVYYLALDGGGRVLRAKVAVLSLDALERGTSARAFHPYFWGRFAQPAALLHARTEAVAARVQAALARAADTFVARVVPVLPAEFDARRLWEQGLLLSYAAELRAERPEAVRALHAAAAGHYEAVTPGALTRAALPVTVVAPPPGARYRVELSHGRRARARLAWAGRRALGKALSVLRLAKAAFTFRGGPEYVAWKIERHAGVAVTLSSRARRFPLLAAWALAWRLYRRRAFR